MSREASRVQTAAFTLIELLVVIAIIAMLIALLLPAIKSAKETTRRTVCGSNMRQIMLGVLDYKEDHKGFMPQGEWGTPTFIGGATRLLSFLGSESLYANTDDESPAANIMRCPSWEKLFPGDVIRYFKNHEPGTTHNPDLVHTTYVYTGGGGRAGELHDGSTWWHGWSTGGSSAKWNEYEDPNQLGPIWHESSRNRTGETAMLTDRMWLPGNLYDPYNWSDIGSYVSLNHPDAKGETSGGSVGMLDGHVEWRNRNIIQERVIVYGQYRPYVCY